MPENMNALVVDGREGIRLRIREILEGFGFRVVGETASGNEAVVLSEVLAPDLVTISLGLEMINGFDVARRIKETSPGTKVVMVTSHYDKFFSREARRAGVDAFLNKARALEGLREFCQALGPARGARAGKEAGAEGPSGGGAGAAAVALGPRRAKKGAST